jgi:DNA-binding transcriptional regulator LsrR (DeoR family)
MSDGRAQWGPGRRVQAAEVADRFFRRQQSKIEIGRELGLSRFQVARYVEGAVKRGLVRITITAGDDLDPVASEAVREAFGLRRALVTSPGTPVASVAGELVAESLVEGGVLGLAWSRTINDMVDRLDGLAPCDVVQLCGTYALPWRRDTSAETVSRAAAGCGGRAYPIYAPLVLPDQRTARALRAQPGVADALGMFRRLSVAVVSVGAWQPGHSTVYDVLPESEQRALAGAGVAAEVAGLLFDADGRVLHTELSDRVLAIDAETLRATPEVVALVRDPRRAAAARAVLRSGLVSTMITDAETAAALAR